MGLSPKERKALLGKSHQLQPGVILGSAALTDAAIEHVRASFGRRQLAKVRISVDSAAECDAVGAELARRVPCEVVRRIGRVLVLFQPSPETEADGPEVDDERH